MLTALALLVHLSVLCWANPAPIRPRAGPSGEVISPAGGTVISQGDILEFIYQPVTEATNPGYATQYINVYIWDEDTDVTTPVAIGLTSPDEEEDAIVSGLIAVNFTWASGEFCGNNLQLVVWEYQTGSEAPTYGFQSAAPSLSIINCHNPTIVFEGHDGGEWFSPTEGATIGLHRDSVLVAYYGQSGEIFSSYSVDIDIQQDTSSIDDESSWSTVIHGLSLYITSAPYAYFSPMHWGFLGGVRLRATVYYEIYGDWTSQISYVNVTVVDTY